MILYKFLLKYEEGGESRWPPQEKTTFKKPNLIRVKPFKVVHLQKLVNQSMLNGALLNKNGN